jgi:hypothetical protein
VHQISQRTTLGDKHPRVDIASVFARAGIPGYIFMEGSLFEVGRAIQRMTTVFHNVTPRLVPLEQRVALLSPRNPLSRPIEEGQWVRVLHGLYRNDIGFVCGHDPSRDAETTVALIPRIKTPKRKRDHRPAPRSWSLEELKAAWGDTRVQTTSDEEYLFCREKYKCGLILKQVPPASLANVDCAPNNIRPFVRASFIRDIPSFAPLVHKFAQDSIMPGQLVKVESGDHRGAIGRPLDVVDSVASLILTSTGDGPMLLIPVRALMPFYEPGHHIKHRWAASFGIVTSVDEVCKTVTYVEKDSQKIVSTNRQSKSYLILIPFQITILMDVVEPSDFPLTFFRITPGMWVEFNGSRDIEQRKRRGYVCAVEETRATVIDEHSLAQACHGMYS